MKNKIYSAIQKGLANALVFDDDDSSISYHKTDIDSEIEFLKVSLDELYDIFKEDPPDIFSYDTIDCFSLITENGQEISLHKYKFNDKPAFLKISNELLKNSGNEIIIACDNNHYISPIGLKWQTHEYQLLPNEDLILINAGYEKRIENDFSGYVKCQMAINAVKNDKTLGHPMAINYCNKIKSQLPNYKGYLPSIGQLIFILKYLDMINYIFKYMGFDILCLNNDAWWTSSEYSRFASWYLYFGRHGVQSKLKNKASTILMMQVLPFFHKIKK